VFFVSALVANKGIYKDKAVILAAVSLQIAPDGSHPTLVTIKCSCGAFHSTLSPSAACTKSVCLLCVSSTVCLLPQSLHRLTQKCTAIILNYSTVTEESANKAVPTV